MHAEAWRIGYEGLFPAAQLASAVDLRRRMWDGRVENPVLGGALFVAEEEQSEVVGFVHFGPNEQREQLGEIYGFFVHPSWWGTGIAQALMERATSSMAGNFGTAILWTHARAGRARRFYGKSGWTETGCQRDVSQWDGLRYPAVEYTRVLSSLDG